MTLWEWGRETWDALLAGTSGRRTYDEVRPGPLCDAIRRRGPRLRGPLRSSTTKTKKMDPFIRYAVAPKPPPVRDAAISGDLLRGDRLRDLHQLGHQQPRLDQGGRIPSSSRRFQAHISPSPDVSTTPSVDEGVRPDLDPLPRQGRLRHRHRLRERTPAVGYGPAPSPRQRPGGGSPSGLGPPITPARRSPSFCAMKALLQRNDEPARASLGPFDAGRDGFVCIGGRDGSVPRGVLGCGQTPGRTSPRKFRRVRHVDETRPIRPRPPMTATRPCGWWRGTLPDAARRRVRGATPSTPTEPSPRSTIRSRRRPSGRLRRARPAAHGQLDQVHDRPHARRGRRREAGSRPSPSTTGSFRHDQLREPRPGLRPRLRAEHGPRQAVGPPCPATPSGSAGRTRLCFPALGPAPRKGEAERNICEVLL